METNINLSKKIAVQHTVRAFYGGEYVETCLRQEFFDIIIEHQFYATIPLSPDNTDEFIVGFLIGTGIIKKSDDILTSRLCEAGKFHVQLTPEIAELISSADGIFNFAQSRTAPNLGEITPIASVRQFSQNQVVEMAGNINTDIQYFAANPYTGVIMPDSTPKHAADKLIGAGVKDDIMIINAPATLELMTRCYYAGIPLAVFSGIPTGGAITYAKKAGITLISQNKTGDYLLYTDSAHRLVY